MGEQLQPRSIRASLAPKYLGMDRNRFNKEVKPYLIAIPIGKQGVAYDRLDLDKWWEQHKARNGRPGALCERKEEQWGNECQGFIAAQTNLAACGTSTKLSTVKDFAKAVEQVTKKKRNGT